MDDRVLATRIELMEDEICLRGRRLNERIHDVEHALISLAEGAHDAACSRGCPGVEVRAGRVLDLFEQAVRGIDVQSIRNEADQLATMKALADGMHRELDLMIEARPTPAEAHRAPAAALGAAA
jgi:hypothetical protein